MTIQLLQNDSERRQKVGDSVLTFIDRTRFSRIRIAVSYIMSSGVAIAIRKLEDFLDEHGTVQLLFGEDFGLSQSKALERLLHSKVEMRVYQGDVAYHPKVWLFDGDDESAIILGSSNLSKSAWVSNIEANVIIDDPQLVKAQGSTFSYLWREFGEPVDQDWINRYRDRERAKQTQPKYKRGGRPDFDANLHQLLEFVGGWESYIRNAKKKGQLEYWRGWYIAPEPAGFDDAQLAELQRVLAAILRSSEYRSDERVKLVPQYTDEIIRIAGVTLHDRPMSRTPEKRRAYFIRQHKNKLEKLHFLRELGKGQIVAVTRLGKRFAAARNVAERRRVYSTAAHNFQWGWARRLDMVDFVTQLLRTVPDNRLYFHEMSYFVMHAWHPDMLEDIRKLIVMFKTLPGNMQTRFISRTDAKLERDLKALRGSNAFGHYQGKVRDTMVSIGYVNGLRYVESDPATYANSYMELA